MRSSLVYVGFAQLCGRSLIMRKIMRVHNRVIPRSLHEMQTIVTVVSMSVHRTVTRLNCMWCICAAFAKLLWPLAHTSCSRSTDVKALFVTKVQCINTGTLILKPTSYYCLPHRCCK